MGSPLAPILSNLFLRHYERVWLNEFVGNGPIFYKRYVDDIISLFNNEEEALHFLDYSSVYRKKTFTGVLTNYLSFTSISYKIVLGKCTLIDLVFRINNTWIAFDKDIGVVFKFLRKNAYPEHLLSKITRNYLHKKLDPISKAKTRSADERFFKLQYMSHSIQYYVKIN